MRVFSYIKNNFLLIFTLFLLAFIPLYPKFPLLDIKHTWVYIRLEDFLVVLAWITFFISYLRKKATLKTPLSLPILVFWIVGGIATLNGVLFIFPKILNVFPNIALLSFLRRIEYMSLFFLAFSAIKKKDAINPLIATLSVTMTGVFIYGIGQRLWGFPAFLTMNEEFAKGIPLRLSALARIPSTFAGHYDLAAYLILLIPVIGSMVFGYKKWYLKILFILIATGGLILLLMTASRVSFAVYLVTIALMFVLQKQKKFILPVVIGSIMLMQSFTGLSQRFAQTFTQVDLVVDARSGKAIGVASGIGPDNQIIIEDKQSTGENLPTGSKYINLPSWQGKELDTDITYKKLKPGGLGEQEIITRAGKVIVKKAFAYDVSFTTRFQGEWPRAVEAFKRNIFFGSGYSSINLATDNSFLRMLGETGFLGFLSFILIFVFIGIYLFRLRPEIEDRRILSLVNGVLAGLTGLALNAILIDVYEASKVAFVLWMLVGVTLGFAHLYQKRQINFFFELKRIITSLPALIAALLVFGAIVFYPSLSNYFAGDDMTWLRWAADCNKLLATAPQLCGSVVDTVLHYFTNSEGFFYRPGTRAYFLLAYPVFELFPLPFHVISVLLHLFSTVLVFFISRKFLKHTVFGFVAALFFLTLSIHSEAVYWISVTGHMVTTALLLIAFVSYVYWRETKRKLLFIGAMISIFVATFFHEFATTGPLLLIAYDLIDSFPRTKSHVIRKWYYLLLLVPIVIYYFMRVNAQSVWFQGDYSYNLAKLPFNVVGNVLGYLITTVSGPISLPYYFMLRELSSSHLAITGIVSLTMLALVVALIFKVKSSLTPDHLKVVLVSSILFIIPLLPFLGLGNLSPRYAYTASVGVVLFLVYLLQQIYLHDKKSKQISLGLITLICLFFIVVQVKQLQKINNDWHKAGQITSDTLVSINHAYSQEGSLPANPVFYFVNTPIKYNDAWVFPQGLEDALWFSFQNTPLVVMNAPSEQEAYTQAMGNKSVKVFKFEQDGSILELNLPKPTPTQ